MERKPEESLTKKELKRMKQKSEKKRSIKTEINSHKEIKNFSDAIEDINLEHIKFDGNGTVTLCSFESDMNEKILSIKNFTDNVKIKEKYLLDCLSIKLELFCSNYFKNLQDSSSAAYKEFEEIFLTQDLFNGVKIDSTMKENIILSSISFIEGEDFNFSLIFGEEVSEKKYTEWINFLDNERQRLIFILKESSELKLEIAKVIKVYFHTLYDVFRYLAVFDESKKYDDTIKKNLKEFEKINDAVKEKIKTIKKHYEYYSESNWHKRKGAVEKKFKLFLHDIFSKFGKEFLLKKGVVSDSLDKNEDSKKVDQSSLSFSKTKESKNDLEESKILSKDSDSEADELRDAVTDVWAVNFKYNPDSSKKRTKSISRQLERQRNYEAGITEDLKGSKTSRLRSSSKSFHKFPLTVSNNQFRQLRIGSERFLVNNNAMKEEEKALCDDDHRNIAQIRKKNPDVLIGISSSHKDRKRITEFNEFSKTKEKIEKEDKLTTSSSDKISSNINKLKF